MKSMALLAVASSLKSELDSINSVKHGYSVILSEEQYNYVSIEENVWDKPWMHWVISSASIDIMSSGLEISNLKVN